MDTGGPMDGLTADQCHELAPIELIERHLFASIQDPQQVIELAGISQRVSEPCRRDDHGLEDPRMPTIKQHRDVAARICLSGGTAGQRLGCTL